MVSALKEFMINFCWSRSVDT